MPSIASSSGSELRVVLAWEGESDLDLYVTDPAAETVYFANALSRSGGRLVRDERCGAPDAGARREEVTWQTPAPGRYRVGVDYIESCDAGRARQPFRVVVGQGGVRREVAGSVGPERFQPIVMEFDVRESPGEGPASLEVAP
jgi:hypothetical protein